MSHRGQDAHRGMVQAPLVAAAGWRFVPTFCDSRFRSFVSKSNPLSTTASATFRGPAFLRTTRPLILSIIDICQ